MAQTHHVVLEFEADSFPATDFVVKSFHGPETLSAGFELAVELVAAKGSASDPAERLGKPARLAVLPKSGETRWIHGLVREVERLDAPHPERQYRVVLVPALWKLGLIRRSRIFQGQSVPEIAKKVVGDALPLELKLQRSYSARVYCVQYRESDLAFFSRLLEEEGIFYFFRHEEDRAVLVLGDSPQAHPSISGDAQLTFLEPTRIAGDEEHVRKLVLEHRLRAGAVTLRDFDFVRPSGDLTTAKSGGSGDGALELYDYPALYSQTSDGKELARVRLEEQSRDTATGTGESTCPRLFAGAIFEVADHPEGPFNQKYLLTGVEHRARSAGYSNRFWCQPASVPFRPPRATPKPCISGAQTAIVVGPSGEEIHTDSHGRIKVQFHWDREGKKDDHSSCWIRVSQASAGQGFGALFLPRIGHEVVVRFLEGDPDRPIVVGSAYNGQNAPPVTLPDERTKSTVRSASTPHADGYNQLSFEDSAGEEKVFAHAQRDEQIEVGNDKQQQVRKNESLSVSKDRSRQVGGNQSLAVSLDDESNIDGAQTLKVLRDRKVNVTQAQSVTVAGAQVITVGRAQMVTVGMASAETVGAAKALSIGGVYAVTVGGAMNEAVGSTRLGEIGASRKEIVGAKRNEQITGDRTTRFGGEEKVDVDEALAQAVTGDFKIDVGGKLEQAVAKGVGTHGKSLEIKADKLTLVVGGKELLTLEKSGAIKFYGKGVTVDASTLTLKGSKIDKVADGTGGSGDAGKEEAPAAGEKKPPPEIKGTKWGKTDAPPPGKSGDGKVPLQVDTANIPDGEKAEMSIHNCETGAGVKGGLLKDLEVKANKVVEKKTGKAPEFAFTAEQLPWDPWDKPFFFFRVLFPDKGMKAEAPSKPPEKGLRVKYLHGVVCDMHADTPAGGGLSTQAEMNEIAGILGGRPHHVVDPIPFNKSKVPRSEWGKALSNKYAYHQASHGNVSMMRSVVRLGSTNFGASDVLNKADVPSVPRYLVYMNTCLAGWEPSLGNAFLARGTKFYIAFRKSIPDGDARAMARRFYRTWRKTKFNPDHIPKVYGLVRRKYIKSMKPMILGGGLTMDHPVVEAVKKVFSSMTGSVGSLFK